MKRSSILIPVILAALALGFSACQKDTTGTPGSSSLGIKLTALNKSYSLPVNSGGMKSASAYSTSITWDTARMVVSRLKFEAELKNTITHHDSVEVKYEWNGPQEINLFDTTVVIGTYALQPGYYDAVELNVEGFKKDAAGQPVFYLSGIYTSNSIVTPIMVKVYDNIQFKTEKDSVNVAADYNSDFTSTILLYLDQLLLDIPPSALDNATLTNGVIIISADSNVGIYKIIMRNLGKDRHCRHHHCHRHGS